MSAELATLGLLKINNLKLRLWRHNFCQWRHQQVYHVTQII